MFNAYISLRGDDGSLSCEEVTHVMPQDHFYSVDLIKAKNKLVVQSCMRRRGVTMYYYSLTERFNVRRTVSGDNTYGLLREVVVLLCYHCRKPDLGYLAE